MKVFYDGSDTPPTGYVQTACYDLVTHRTPSTFWALNQKKFWGGLGRNGLHGKLVVLKYPNKVNNDSVLGRTDLFLIISQWRPGWAAAFQNKSTSARSARSARSLQFVRNGQLPYVLQQSYFTFGAEQQQPHFIFGAIESLTLSGAKIQDHSYARLARHYDLRIKELSEKEKRALIPELIAGDADFEFFQKRSLR